jgi:hypothetical protein
MVLSWINNLVAGLVCSTRRGAVNAGASGRSATEAARRIGRLCVYAEVGLPLGGSSATLRADQKGH